MYPSAHRLSACAVLCATVLSLLIAACGSGAADSAASSPSAPSTTPGPAATASQPVAGASVVPDGPSAREGVTQYPLTIDNCGREVTFGRRPERVLLLNGASVAEVNSFVALGITDTIAANSQSYGVSDDPGMVEAVAAVPTGGLTLNENYAVPREQILAQQPDLVISTWSGGFDDTSGSITRDQLAEAGIASYVTPANCAFGNPAPRPEDEAAYAGQSIESSFQLLTELGRIFDVQSTAETFIAGQRERLDVVADRVAGADRPSVLVVYPGMSSMNANGLPAVFGGGIWDAVIEAAGGTNPFAGATTAELSELNAEALAAADVDVLVVGLFQPDEDVALLAEDVLSRFPSWDAAKEQRWTSVSDGAYLGPLNATAVEGIAAAAHPHAE